MAFTFERMEKDKPITLKLRERKYRMVLYEENEDPALLMPSFLQGELTEPNPVVVMILETFIWDEDKEELWDIDGRIEIINYENNMELTVPLDTIWNEDFLEFGRGMKWFRYSFKNKKKRKKMKDVEGRNDVETAEFETTQSFGEKLRKFIGIPTEEEWMDRQQKTSSRKREKNQ